MTQRSAGGACKQLPVHSAVIWAALIDRYGIRQVLLAIPQASIVSDAELALHA